MSSLEESIEEIVKIKVKNCQVQMIQKLTYQRKLQGIRAVIALQEWRMANMMTNFYKLQGVSVEL